MEKVKIGWIGTGVMGFHMCKYIMNAGHTVLVYNRTMSKAKELIDLGAKESDPISMAKEVDYLFMMLGYPHDVEKMVLDSENGLINYMKKGSFLIDHTTSSPSLAKKIFEECAKKGIYSFDAPVTGGDIGAKNGTLLTLVGGDKDKFSEIKPILALYSKTAEYLGEAGVGQHTKAVNQIMVATNIIGVCEALIYAHKAGLDVGKTFDLLSEGAGSSKQLSIYTPRMLKRDFEPGFYVEHFHKDMGIALEECKRMGIELKGLSLVYSLFEIMKKDGLERKGHHGLLLTLEKLNNIKL